MFCWHVAQVLYAKRSQVGTQGPEEITDTNCKKILFFCPCELWNWSSMHLCTLGGSFMRWFSELQVSINRLSANQMAVHQGVWAGWRRLAEVQTAGQHREPQSSALLCETKHLSHGLAWSDVCWQKYFYTTNCPANRGSLNSPNYGL